ERAIALDPKYAPANHGLGIIYQLMKMYERAATAFRMAVRLDSKSGTYRSSLINVLRKLGHGNEADEEVISARELIAKEIEYNRACFAAIMGDEEEALRLLRLALEKKQVNNDWPSHDPDFDSLRSDPRFIALMEEMKPSTAVK